MVKYIVRKNKSGDLKLCLMYGMSPRKIEGHYETKEAALMAYQEKIDTQFAENDEERKVISQDQFKLHELMYENIGDERAVKTGG